MASASSGAQQAPPSTTTTTSSPFPFAAAPDIIRAHQKDVYFQGLLTNQIIDLHRRLLGARSAHTWANESRTAADLLYLCLTTLLGNRTLGEEYCDLIQVEAPPNPNPNPNPHPKPKAKPRSNTSTSASTIAIADTDDDGTSTTSSLSAAAVGGGPRLPSLRRRSTYIAVSILAPYMVSRLLPAVRSRLRSRLEARLVALQRKHKSRGLEYRAGRHLLAHLPAITSGTHLHAVVLATFYFSGAYYSLSKRVTGLRYVFTRRLPEQQQQQQGDGRAGYEVLGVLLVAQLAVRAWLHLRSALQAPGSAEAGVEAAIRERALGNSHGAGDINNNNNNNNNMTSVSLDHEHSYGGANDLLLVDDATPGGGGSQRSMDAIGAMAHTPVPGSGRPRYDLRDDKVLGWVKGKSQRKCTLCLEELKDPSATQCGHVFCWSCIGDWVREKPECPLCRREALVQHILPLRVM